jgi:hypothetical protein
MGQVLSHSVRNGIRSVQNGICSVFPIYLFYTSICIISSHVNLMCLFIYHIYDIKHFSFHLSLFNKVQSIRFKVCDPAGSFNVGNRPFQVCKS